jgi:hypothetical protein
MKTIMVRAAWAVLLAASVGRAQVLYNSPEDDQPILDKPGQDPVYYLEFVFERPRWIEVAEQDPKTKDVRKVKYFYMPYKVTNFEKKKVEFRPEFVLHTSTGRAYRTAFSSAAFEAIKKEIRRDYLVSQADLNTTGIPEGEENVKHSVAIFREFDSRADEFDIFVGSLTNYPPRKIKNPLWKENQAGDARKEEEYFLANRMLRIHCLFPGYKEGRLVSHASVQVINWVWRSESN